MAVDNEKHVVTGDQYLGIDGKIFDIRRQLRRGLKKAASPLNPVLAEKSLQKIVEGKFYNVIDIPPLVVDYDKFWEEMLKACKLDYVNKNITSENFPIKGRGTEEVGLSLINFEYGYDIASETIIKEIEKNNIFSIARIEHQFVLAANFPNFQKLFPIIAFGSHRNDSDGLRHVPCLGGHTSERDLLLYCLEHDRRGDDRFLAVRKKSN